MIFGGVTIKEVIVFETQVMMGAQFGRVKQAKKPEDLMIACLRMGWNDAFRHTSENVKTPDGKQTILEKENKKYAKGPMQDDVICCEILNTEIVLDTFKEYAATTDKVQVVERHFEKLKGLFGRYKKLCGPRSFCFGHIQKMFNIALKLYVCLYLCREYLGLTDRLFDKEILNGLSYADCPVDSIILNDISKRSGDKQYRQYVWSHFGRDDNPTDRYTSTQEKIDQLNDKDGNAGKSRLYYDFTRWRSDEVEQM